MMGPMESKEGDLVMLRCSPDYSSFGGALSTSMRRRGPGKSRRQVMVKRMGLDLAGELDSTSQRHQAVRCQD